LMRLQGIFRTGDGIKLGFGQNQNRTLNSPAPASSSQRS
jgi:hypothetical protein